MTLLKNKIKITAKFRKDHRLFNKLEFRYYYDNPTKLLNDFKEYREVTSSNPISTTKSSTDNALTMVNNIRQVWTAIDPARSIFPRNFLRDPDLIEDYFFRPQLQLLEQNLKLLKEAQTHHIQASTIKSKLLCVSTFCKFLYNRGIFININTEELNHVQSKVRELCSTLKKHIGQREKIVSKFTLQCSIRTDQFLKYRNLEHIKGINEKLKKHSEHDRDAIKFNKQQAISNKRLPHAFVELFQLSSSVKSNEHDEIDDAWVLTNLEYKTSMVPK